MILHRAILDVPRALARCVGRLLSNPSALASFEMVLVSAMLASSICSKFFTASPTTSPTRVDESARLNFPGDGRRVESKAAG